MIRLGDIVSFYSSFAPFQYDYIKRSPGVVLKEKSAGIGAMKSYEVLWKDGSVTTEREGYLQILEIQ